MTSQRDPSSPSGGTWRGFVGLSLFAVLAPVAFIAGWLFAAPGADPQRQPKDVTAAPGLDAQSQSSRSGERPGRTAHVTAPAGMVYVPGGVTHIGANDGLPDERPIFRAKVAPYFMDVHPVTVAQFRAFVQATAYLTEAERLGDAAVYDERTGGWRLVAGANWRRPMGPEATPAPDDHPVTQVSWNDAAAYARWAGKRLPTEVEWEHAARNARDARSRYSWGDSLEMGGRHRANTWQGSFPGRNTGEDGHLYTSPVGTYGRTELGLMDMGGNVWEWTADWFRPYDQRDRPYTPDARSERVQRGGSFLCHPSYCHGYRVSARSHSTPDSSLYHVGFRLVKDIDA